MLAHNSVYLHITVRCDGTSIDPCKCIIGWVGARPPSCTFTIHIQPTHVHTHCNFIHDCFKCQFICYLRFAHTCSQPSECSVGRLPYSSYQWVEGDRVLAKYSLCSDLWVLSVNIVEGDIGNTYHIVPLVSCWYILSPRYRYTFRQCTKFSYLINEWKIGKGTVYWQITGN